LAFRFFQPNETGTANRQEFSQENHRHLTSAQIHLIQSQLTYHSNQLTAKTGVYTNSKDLPPRAATHAHATPHNLSLPFPSAHPHANKRKKPNFPTHSLRASSSSTAPPPSFPSDCIVPKTLAHSCIRNAFPKARIHARSQNAFPKLQTRALPEDTRIMKGLSGEHAEQHVCGFQEGWGLRNVRGGELGFGGEWEIGGMIRLLDCL